MSDTPEQAAMFGDWGPIHRPEDTDNKQNDYAYVPHPENFRRHWANKRKRNLKAKQAAKKARKRNRRK